MLRTRQILFGLAALVIAASVTLRAEEDGWKAERRDVRIPMRDGKSLAADLYLPDKPGKYPTILIQTPYDKNRFDAPFRSADAQPSEGGRGSVSDALQMLDREHYVYAVVDWRGFYGSKDAKEGVQLGKWRRGQDGFDTVEWLAAQAFSDGKVGTWGGSALGKQQFDTALEHPPHLVCCVPLIASMGQSYAQYYEDGVPLESYLKTLDRLGYGISEMVKRAPDGGGLVWKFAERRTYKPEQIEVPCLVITGWFDLFPDLVLKTFEDIVAKGGERAKAHSKLILGPWTHTAVGLAKQGDLDFEGATKFTGPAAKQFFDRWLRGEDNGWEKTPRVRYFAANGTAWQAAESWDAIPRETRTLYLDATGKLTPEKPAEQAAGQRAYTYDPKDPPPTLGGANLPPMKFGPTDHAALDARKDVLAYTSAALKNELRINGRVELSFGYVANRTCCDFTARLCEVRADGKPYLIASAAARCREVKPGEPARVTLRFPVTAYTLTKGHALRVYLASGDSPRYERNPHTGEDHWDEKTALTLDVAVGHANAELKIPVEKPAE